ncbi:Phospholipid-transporting ATPase 1 [Hordeum vulgare]|nr:Phospholipid-transporting ATPase 1 [Hordeum vulgare]
MDLDGFPLDHVFPDDYGLDEEDEMDIDGEPLFEDELATQAVRVQPNARGKEAEEEVGEGEKPRPRGKTNSRKEDKWDTASIALITTSEGMMTKNDSREEKRRQDKEEKMNAFMEIQRRRLEMEVEKQTRMLEIEAKNQAKMPMLLLP